MPSTSGPALWIADDVPSTRHPLYCRGNTGEVFPNVVTPLTATLIGDAAQVGQRLALLEVGALIERDLDESSVGALTGIFGGYLYGNLSVARLMGVRSPGMKPTDIDTQMFGTSDAPPYRRRRGDRSPVATLRVARFFTRIIRGPDLSWLDDERAEVESWLASLPAFGTASDDELLAIADQLPRWLAAHMRSLVVSSVYAGALAAIVERFAARRARVDPGITIRLTTGIGAVETTGPSLRLWALARTVAADATLTAHFDAGVAGALDRLREERNVPTVGAFLDGFDAFVAEFGSRGPDEYETASETWGTSPDLALAAVERLRFSPADADPVAAARRLADDRVRAVADVRAGLPGPLRPLFDRTVASAALATAGRERAKATLVLALYGVRVALFELARRAQERGGPAERRDCWLVTRAELPAFVADPSSLAGEIAERGARRDELQSRVPPFVFEGTIPLPETWPRRDARAAVARLGPGEELVGMGVSPGVRRGRARIVLDPADPTALGPGDVMVAPITDPAWTPLFLAAEAVVVDVGAQQSHAAIVARELGIPAVVSAIDATRRLRDGDLVEVDGDSGIVRVIG